MTKLTIENVYTRHKAKELTKKHFWKLLGMMAIAFGIPFVLMTITTAFFPPSVSITSRSSSSVKAPIDNVFSIVFKSFHIKLYIQSRRK